MLPTASTPKLRRGVEMRNCRPQHPGPAPPPRPAVPSARSVARRALARVGAAAHRVSVASSPSLDEASLAPAKAQATLVDFFRQASPYIAGHRGRTFVVVIPGEVVAQEDVLDGVLSDVALCHDLGVRTVLVVGCCAQIDALLRVRGLASHHVAGLRVTDPPTLQIAMEAAGKVLLSVSAALSKGPPVPALRKHGEVRHGASALRVACGNFVAAKRRGVVGGVDYGETGEVRHIDAEAIHARLSSGDIVLLSNLGNSAAGEVLNCQTWEVAAQAATQLKADKMLCFARNRGGLVTSAEGQLVRWLPLQEAEACLAVAECVAAAAREQRLHGGGASALASTAASAAAPSEDDVSWLNPPPSQAKAAKAPKKNGGAASSKAHASARAPPFSMAQHPPASLELAAAVAVCRAGVPRCHVLDARVEGALLLELYTCDGVGTMVSQDAYEGTRAARLEDAPRISKLLAPLEADGTLVRRDKAALIRDVGAGRFTVVERDGKVVGSAALVPYPAGRAAEVAAFAIDPRYRGSGRGDALLEFVERKARAEGAQRLFLLTTRAADWFQQRGFVAAGRAAGSPQLPPGRSVDPTRNSLLFVKSLEEES